MPDHRGVSAPATAGQDPATAGQDPATAGQDPATAGQERPQWPGADDIDALDAIAQSHQLGGGQPGLAYGIVAGGRLVHAGGAGEQWAGGPVPEASTVFRIASMTKSFTASAVLALRDDGALVLDDLAEDYVPELRGLSPASADSRRITIRNLLTMTAGFPTDDPWGDRQQGTPAGEFAQFLAGGVRFAWAPGTRFEYSNLGYAILGRVVAAASAAGYAEFVRDRLLRPLALASTRFEAGEFDAARLARGYRHGSSGWEELVPDGYGAFAPMGGIFSSVSDLARWVAGFAAAFPPGGEDDGGPHPLSRAARREMQLPQVALPPQAPSLPAGSGPGSYGFGLFVEEDAEHGRIVQHSGGYPGFGSNMRWHVASGTGVIVLANGTYAPAYALASKLLYAVLRRQPSGEAGSSGGAVAVGRAVAVGGPVPAPGGPWPETLSAQREVTGLLRSWDEAIADRLFSPNVAQDEPYAERRQAVDEIRQRIGEFGPDQDRPPEFDSAAHCRWWLRGEHGVVQAEIRLTPQWQPRVQALVLAVPPAPDSALRQLLDGLVTLLNEGASQWPSSLPVSAGVDTGLLIRQLRMAASWAGHCRAGAFCSGNGETSVGVELDGELARLILTVSADPVQHLLRQAEITLAT